MRVAVYTSVCEEDAAWLPVYLGGLEREGLPFYMHFDRCGPDLRTAVKTHPLCRGWTARNDPTEFDETHKQGVFDRLRLGGHGWALGLDVDEVPARGFRAVLDRVVREEAGADVVDFKWVNVWGDDATLRTDGPFGRGHRSNLYNLGGGRRWAFTHKITNGAKLLGADGGPAAEHVTAVRHDLVVVHRGLMTPQLAAAHKARWDRIYSTALRGDPNPYQFWRYAADPANAPVLQPNDHL